MNSGGVRRWSGLALLFLLVAGAGLLTMTTRSQADVTVDVTIAGPGESGGLRGLDLSSFGAAVASAESGGGFAVEIPGAAGLGAVSMGSTSVIIDTDDHALIMTGQLPTAGATFAAALIVDFDGSSPGLPTVSLGLKGDIDLTQLNSSWTAPSGAVVVDGFAVVSTGLQDLRTMTAAAGFYGDIEQLPAGMDVRGSITVADHLPGLTGPNVTAAVRGRLDADLPALLTSKNLTPSDPTSAKLTATIAAADLDLPITAGNFEFTVGVEGTGPNAPLAVTASGSVTVDNDRFAAAAVTFDVLATADDTTTSLSGGIADGSTWSEPFGLSGVTVNSARAALVASTTADTTATFEGSFSFGSKVFTVDAETDGSDLALALELPRVNVGEVVDLMTSMGFTTGTVNADLRSLGIAPTRMQFETSGGDLSGAISTGITFRGKTAKLLISGDTAGTANLLIAVQVPGGTLGDYVDAAPAFAAIPIPEGGVVVSRRSATQTAYPAGSIEGDFLAEMYCGADATGPCTYSIPSGVSFAARIQLPETVTDVLAQFGPVGTNGTLRVVGSIPVFGGRGLDLDVELPSILPGADSPAWFREAQIVVTLSVDSSSIAFGIEGRLTVALPDEDEPGGVDVVTFQIDATLEAGAAGVGVTIGGGLAPGSTWDTPFGVDWLDLQAFRIEITVEVAPTPSVQLGVRAKARIGPSTFDASFAVNVRAAVPVPVVTFGLRVEADQIRLRDVATMAARIGDTTIDTDELPDASLRNVALKFSTLDAPNLCLSPGIKISADLYLDAPTNSAGAGGELPVDSCVNDTQTAAEQNTRCLNDDACFARVSFEVGENGIKASGALNSLDLGPIEVDDARISLEITPQVQALSVSGGVKIPGFFEANGSIDISNTGFAFSVTVSDSAGNLVTVSAAAGFDPNGMAATFKANLFVRLPSVNEALLDVQRLADKVQTFFTGDPFEYLLSFRCLEVGVDISTSTTDALSGRIFADIHFGYLHQTTPSLSQGKVWGLEWDFDADVLTNLEGLVSALGDPLGDDNTGCRIPPESGVFQNVILNVNESSVTYEGDLSDSYARTFGESVFLRALFTTKDPALYEVTFDNGQGQTAVRTFRQQTLTSETFFVDVPSSQFRYRADGGGVDDQGVGRYVLTATLRVAGKDTILMKLQLPVVVTDGTSVGHRIDEFTPTYAEGEQPLFIARWANRQGEPTVTSQFFLDGEAVSSASTVNRPGADNPRTYPNNAGVVQPFRLPPLEWAGPDDDAQVLTHRLTYPDGSVDEATFTFAVEDTTPFFADICVEGLCVTPGIDDPNALPVFVAAENSRVQLGVRDPGAEIGGADNPYIVTMDGDEVGGLSFFGDDAVRLFDTLSGARYSYSLSDQKPDAYEAGVVYDVEWTLSCWFCPGSTTFEHPMLVVEDNDEFDTERAPLPDGRSPWYSTVVATFQSFEGGCGAVEYVVQAGDSPEAIRFAIVDSLTIANLEPSSMTVRVFESDFDTPPGLRVVDGVATWVSVPGEKYYVSVADDHNRGEGACRFNRKFFTSVFQVDLSRTPAPPVNDAAANALPTLVSTPLTLEADLTSAGVGPFEAARIPSCWVDGAQHTVFYDMTLVRSAQGSRMITVEAEGGVGEGGRTASQLAVYELGSGGAVGSELACANDGEGAFAELIAAESGEGGTVGPRATFFADEGKNYLVVLDSIGRPGPVTIHVNDAGARTPVDLVGDDSGTAFTFRRRLPAGDVAALAPCWPAGETPVSVFAWTAPSTAPIRVDVTDGDVDAGIAVTRGSDIPTACSTGDSVELNPVEGAVYLFFVSTRFGGTSVDVDVTTTGPPFTPAQDSVLPPIQERTGYWMLGEGGEIYAFGDAEDIVPTGTKAPVTSPAVKLLEHPDGTGLWVLERNGTIHNYGAAAAFGPVSTAGFLADETVATMAATPGGQGLFVFTTRGRTIVFGDATHHGDLVELGLAPVLNGPVVDSTALPDGSGYYMVGTDGGLFAFGQARFAGSIPQILPPGGSLNSPVNGLVADPDGTGYWMVAGDGGVFAFEAGFVGSIPGILPPGASLNQPINGLVPYFNGYLMVASDGGVFAFSDGPFLGSLGGQAIPSPIVGIAPIG